MNDSGNPSDTGSGTLTDRQFLAEVIKDGLRNDIGPLLEPGRARLVLQTACELIDDLAGKAVPNTGRLPESELKRVDALVRRMGANPGSPDRALASLVLRAADASGPDGEEARQLLASITAGQEEAIRSLPTLQDAGEMSGSGSLANQPEPRPAISALLQAYLAEQKPLGAEFEVRSVRRLSSGMSKETYLAIFEDSKGRQRKLFVRKDGAFSSLTTTVVDEFPLLSHLATFRLPIARVLGCEADRSICGAPFMLVEAMPGGSDVSTWGDPALLRAVGLQLAEFLARLHAVPTAEFVADPPFWLDPLHLCRSVTGMRAAWENYGRDGQPLMVAVLDWLEANEPPAQGRQVLVHGDVGLYNLLIEGHTVTAVVDWEMCHLGQPEEDLLCVRRLLGEAMSWSEFLEAYRSHGGQYEGQADERYYGVFTMARIALSIFHIEHAMHTHDPALDTKEVYIGSRYTQRIVLEAFKLIAQNPGN